MADYGAAYANARERVLAVLADLEWHSWRVLQRAGGIRFGARLRELRRLGYQLISRADPAGANGKQHGKQYRLLSPDPVAPQGKKVKVYIEEPDVVSLLFEDKLSDAATSALAEALDTFRANREKL